MARDFIIPGESLVFVKGRSDSAIASLTQLGLSNEAAHVRPQFNHKDINVDAWGDAPADVQWMLGTLTFDMPIIHQDYAALEECIKLSMGGWPVGGALAFGQMARAGTRMGGNFARFAPGNNYISLSVASPIANKPWRFFYAYLTSQPLDFSLGTEKAVTLTSWRVVPYTQDPAGIVGGVILGAQAYPLWDRTLDT